MQEFFFNQPYGSISKTDLQEKIFFLLDEYSGNSLTSLSDYELGLKLKCTRQKAAALKASVTAKFGEPFKPTDYVAFCSEFFRLEVYPSPDSGKAESKELCIAIESVKIRNFLDYIFLVELHRAIEYKNNRTLVAIDYEAFKGLLDFLGGKIKKSDGEVFDQLQSLNSFLNKKIVKEKFGAIIGNVFSAAEKAVPMFELAEKAMAFIANISLEL